MAKGHNKNILVPTANRFRVLAMRGTTKSIRQSSFRTQLYSLENSTTVDETNKLLSTFDALYRCFVAGTSLACGFGLIILLSLLYLSVRPFSRPLYRRLAASLGASSFLDAISLLLPNFKLLLTPDSDILTPIGTSIIVCNHSLDGFDWWAMLMLGRCLNLHGSIRIFLKKSPTNGGACEHFNAPPLKFLINLLEYPLLPSVHGKDYVRDRSGLFEFLRGFADESNCNGASFPHTGNNPVHFLLFPEGTDRNQDMAEFARREGRPQLKHLLLPRTTGFNASLESLRSSRPVVYDVTIAHSGYGGKSLVADVNPWSLFWRVITQKIPEVHIRMKKYHMEDVLRDSQWLDQCWIEKDRLLEHFYRHKCFPRAGANKCRILNTRFHSIEGSIVGLFRLLMMPFLVPIIIIVSIPLAWIIGWIWFAYQTYILLLGPTDEKDSSNANSSGKEISGIGTPFVPVTPFVSPITRM